MGFYEKSGTSYKLLFFSTSNNRIWSNKDKDENEKALYVKESDFEFVGNGSDEVKFGWGNLEQEVDLNENADGYWELDTSEMSIGTYAGELKFGSNKGEEKVSITIYNNVEGADDYRNKTYEIQFDSLVVNGDNIKANGQGSTLEFNSAIANWYTCFYVMDQNTGWDASGELNENNQEKRNYIGTNVDDFIIEAKSENSDEWVAQSELDEKYQLFSISKYDGSGGVFYNIFRVDFDVKKDDRYNGTSQYKYRLRYKGDNEYLGNENQNNVFDIGLSREEDMVDFDISEYKYDEKNNLYDARNVEYFNNYDREINTKLIIRPGVTKSVAEEKTYGEDDYIFIKDDAVNIKFYRYGETNNELVELGNDSPFTVEWIADKDWYSIKYNPEKDFYGSKYAMRYTGGYNEKINGSKYKEEGKTEYTVANQSAFWTGKSTTYAESNTVDATLGDNVDKKRISTIGVVFRNSVVTGGAKINITTDEGEITLGGSLSTNIGSISASGDVSFEMRDLLKDDYGLKDDQKKVIKGCEKAFDFKITSNNEKVEFGETGYAEIEIPCDRGMAIYYIDGEGNKTLISSTYEDGKIKFKTNHFSTYVVAPAESTGGSTTGGGTVVTPATDEVKTTTDGNITTTIKDVKTETVKNESGQEITKTTAAVSAATANKLVNQAVSDKSEVIEVTVKSDSQTKVNGEKSTELEIPKSAVESIVKNTDASLVVKTDSGEVTLDNKTLETIAAEAEGDTVRIVVNENTQLKEEQKPAADAIGDNGKVFDIAAIIGGKYIHDFKGGKDSVTLPMPEKLKGKDIVIVYINDKGICEILNHTMEPVGAEEYIKFTTSHFSTFAIVEKADAEKIIAQQNAEKVKTLIKEVSLKATTSKTSKKNVKVKVAEVDKTNSLIKEIESMGYTVKYRFCRSAKASSSYVGKKTKAAASWINTKGTKGTKYYYKAKVYVYDGDELIAKTLLKQCSYSGRTWSK